MKVVICAIWCNMYTCLWLFMCIQYTYIRMLRMYVYRYCMEEGGTECYVDEDVKLYANKPSKANSQDFEKQSWCQCRAEEKHLANCVTRKGRPSDTFHKLPLPQLQCRITSARFWLVLVGLGTTDQYFASKTCIDSLESEMFGKEPGGTEFSIQ